MRFAALISGGKDSCYNIFQSIQHGHVLVCLIHLIPPNSGSSFEESNSFMYQTAGSGVVAAYADCFGVEIIQHIITGSSLRTSLEYIDKEVGDEVEDLYQALLSAQAKYLNLEGVACGAILSNYQRNRVESVCQRLDLRVISYLWQRDQQQLLNEMLFTHHMQIILVKVAGAGLDPYKHLNRDLASLYPILLALNGKYGLDLCGEGGEYESLVLDAPFFQKRIVIDETEFIVDENDSSVGNLLIKAWHLEEKDNFIRTSNTQSQTLTESLQAYLPAFPERLGNESEDIVSVNLKPRFTVDVDGFGVTPLLTAAPVTDERCQSYKYSDAQTQLGTIMNNLAEGLNAIGVVLKDAIYVHLYLCDMADFTAINDVYCQYFGHNPPSRSCIMVMSSMNWLVALSVTYLKGSYTAASSTTVPSPLLNHLHIRQVLHVRSLSQWAPLCIGPYSQANTVHHFLSFVAGQIPLDPATMVLRPWSNDAASTDSLQEMSLDIILCMRHIFRILSVLGSDNKHLLSLVLFVNDSIFSSNEHHGRFAEVINRCCHAMKATSTAKQTRKVDFNAVDEMDDSELAELDSAELESKTTLPSLIVVKVPGLPRNAPVEIEAIGYRKNHVYEEKWQSFNDLWPFALNDASASSAPTPSNIHAWTLWGASSPDYAKEIMLSRLSVHVSAKWFPETVFSGAFSVVPLPALVDNQSIGRNYKNIRLYDVVETVVRTMQQVLQTAKIRWRQVKVAKIYYSTTILPLHNVHELQSVFEQCLSSEVRHLSVVIVPCLTGENNALLTVQLIALDLQQVETEAWINMRD